MTRYALLSVSDRDGLAEFAKGLTDLGFELLTTSGTGKFLAEAGVEALSIEEYTAQAEILGGRVKTLHPKIHAGILAQRDKAEDVADLEKQEIFPIDLVAVNLYPFEQKLRETSNPTVQQMIEYIDIGGPTMIRAAAKNCAHVYAVIDPADYPAVLKNLENPGSQEESFAYRQSLSAKVFSDLVHYNLEIAKFLSVESAEAVFPKYSGVSLSRRQSLRYGENPQQQGCLYKDTGESVESGWAQLQGKELSYNNILDADAGFRITRSLMQQKGRFKNGSLVSVMKHLSPCGVAVGDSPADALQRAKQSDPRSHFGGIIGFVDAVEREAAEECVKDFCEIVVAPSFSDDAREVFAKKKNIRLLECDLSRGPVVEVRSTLFGHVAQELDKENCELTALEVAAGETPSAELYQELALAWCIVSHVKSNAIVIVKDGMLLGAGGGQTSRIDSVEVALMKAKEHGHDTRGAVAASDAFFPFPDSVERLAEAGITAIVSPGGSVKDPEVIKVAKEKGVSFIFAPERHFRH